MDLNTLEALPAEIIAPVQTASYSRLLALPAAFTLVLLEIEPLRRQAAQEGANHLAHLYLSPAERDCFFSFTYEKRRFEWLGGRIAAKRAAAALLDPDAITPPWLDWTITVDSQGRPFMSSWPCLQKPPEISISHSGGLAAGMAAHRRCGLDLQEIVARIEKVEEKFCRPEEETLLATAAALSGIEHRRRLTMLWAAKEAFRKTIAARPLAGFLALKLQGCSGSLESGLCLDFSYTAAKEKAAGLNLLPLRAVVTQRHHFILAFTVLPG